MEQFLVLSVETHHLQIDFGKFECHPFTVVAGCKGDRFSRCLTVTDFDYPLVNVYLHFAVGKSTIFNGKTRYFYGHVQ